MQMLYNSDNYAVVQIELTAEDAPVLPPKVCALTRGGYEIVDKFARKELFIEGLWTTIELTLVAIVVGMVLGAKAGVWRNNQS